MELGERLEWLMQPGSAKDDGGQHPDARGNLRKRLKRATMSGAGRELELEKEYWDWFRRVQDPLEQAFYSNDVEGSAFPLPKAFPHPKTDVKADQRSSATSDWNLNTLPLRSILKPLGSSVPGVTAPMLYIGMKFSTFTWHYEDNKMYSASFHHGGAPRTWYGVADHAGRKFEEVLRKYVMRRFDLQSDGVDMILSKTTMFTPAFLKKHDVDVVSCVQRPGDFVITLPGAYHAGFGHGISICEAANFALPDWLPYLHKTTDDFRRMKKQCVMREEQIVMRSCEPYLSASPRAKAALEPAPLELVHAMERIFKDQQLQRQRVRAIFLDAYARSAATDRRLSRTAATQRTLREIVNKKLEPEFETCDRCKYSCFVARLHCATCDTVVCLRCDFAPTCACIEWHLECRYSMCDLAKFLAAVRASYKQGLAMRRQKRSSKSTPQRR